jgi:O-glycosyl hydrolase
MASFRMVSVLMLVTAAAVALAGLLAVPAGAGAQAGQDVTLDGSSAGRVFDGVGALSAGASSRLLTDYPEPERSQILDYLFTPGYGASLQTLKVEIGSDTNSTDGSEPSHMRSPADLDCDRGYEWWLMEQAKARNPAIKLYALQWGAPGWVGSNGTLWTQQDITYLLAWLGCAQRHGLHIDYLGGWNEKDFSAAWYTDLAAALRAHGYTTQVVAADSFGWSVADAMTADPAFRDAVDVVGVHYPCGYLGSYQSCPSTPAAQALGTPLWASEQGSLPYDSGAAPLARAINRAYLDGRMTATINWSLIASWYNTLPFQGAGLMEANQPWSGAYTVGPSIWVTAQTAQFTQPGWRYLDSASGYLAGGGSYVTLRSPVTGDYSVIVETVDATAAQPVTFTLRGGLSAGPVHLWSTDLTSANPADWFVPGGGARPQGGAYTAVLRPGRVYTLTTTTGQGKGRATGPAPRPWPLPYHDTFAGYPAGATPRYLSDLDGAFQTAPCGGGRPGMCLRQVITQQPVDWNGLFDHPVTVIGDAASWRDYTVNVAARPAATGWVELIGRMDGEYASALSGIHLRLSADGSWQLYDQVFGGGQAANAEVCGPSNPSCPSAVSGPRAAPAPAVLASGRIAAGTAGTAGGGWHQLGLGFRGNQVTAYLDGQRVAAVTDGTHVSGQAGLAVSPWQTAEFSDLRIDPVPGAPGPRFLPGEQLTAAATSSHPGYEPRNAVDGSVASLWHSEYSPHAPLPQSVTIGLGGRYQVSEVTYQPRADGKTNGIITGYTLSVSTDGVHFTRVAAGSWALNSARKQVVIAPRAARFVRLTALQGGGGYASAAEIGIGVTP